MTTISLLPDSTYGSLEFPSSDLFEKAQEDQLSIRKAKDIFRRAILEPQSLSEVWSTVAQIDTSAEKKYLEEKKTAING